VIHKRAAHFAMDEVRRILLFFLYCLSSASEEVPWCVYRDKSGGRIVDRHEHVRTCHMHCISLGNEKNESLTRSRGQRRALKY